MCKGIGILILMLLTHFCSGQSITPAGTVNICSNQSQILFVESLLPGETVQWQKNGVDIPGELKPDYIARSTGDYRVKLKDGKFTNTVKVVVNEYPAANFTSSWITNQCSNEAVTFTNISTGAASYLWDFGDPESDSVNNSSTQLNPKHTFIGKPGNLTQSFTIKMKAISAAGGCFTEKSQSITLKQIPDGTIGGTGDGIFRGKKYFKICGNVPTGEFTFTNQSTTKATNVDYRINWGDGSPDFAGPDFTLLTHTYDIGTHKLSLTIHGKNGCESNTEYYVFVGTNPAVGLANPGNTATCSGEALTFPITETANNVPGTFYTLTFNDGSPARE